MAHSELVKISLFLNLTVERICEAGSVERYITPAAGALAALEVDNAETQCMEIGTGLWIANNTLEATVLQRGYLTALGINSKAQLMEHMRHQLSRVLPTHPVSGISRYVINNSPKEQMLRSLYQLDAETVATVPRPFAIKNAGGPALYNLNVNPPSLGAITFIRGEYDGLPLDRPCHAEQLLLAAALLRGQTAVEQPGMISVGGCKLPCGDCAGVLATVKERRGYWFEYADQKTTDARDATGQVAFAAGRARIFQLPPLAV